MMSLPSALAGRIAEWVAIASVAVGGGIYVGSVETQGDTNTADIGTLKPVVIEVAVDIGVLKERTGNMNKTLDRLEQQQQAILNELRK